MKQLLLLILITLTAFSLSAQSKSKKADNPVDTTQQEDNRAIKSATIGALKLRSIGPAFTSGRIADIAIHPDDPNIWFVAVGSGGVWKTVNAGISWSPVFDNEGSYSIGCVTIDPNNPNIVWVGTGENVGGRHVGFGDGIYRSTDSGRSWKNMGLKASEHLSKIIVYPGNSDIIYVAAQGPLWSSGGERGFYKSMDGGQTWNKTLGDDEWTGVTDIAIDPRNPDVIYAATWQRHRTVAAYMGGGPGSGIHKSTDGGDTWEELKSGLPGGNMGKIGIAVSPHKPDVIYAAIELDRTTGGVYRSTDRGASWSKQSNTVSGGTGPHYYQELYACPHEFDRLYLCDVRIQVSDNGGQSFRRLNERNKHSDNHAIAFRSDDPDYLLVGSDGGLYESLDLADNWRFINNMPITQYYKVAVDDRLPFYHVFGGTQDNGSHGGPSRTDSYGGITNADWYVTLGADGHQSATEPGNPHIGYAETQKGGLHRIDRISGEQIFIQPQSAPGQEAQRYNWDAPILVSPHNPARIYFASQQVWCSNNRGDSWDAISGDLTRNEDRMELKIMGKIQSWDSPWDLKAMSNYNTITSLSESPLKEGLIYAGTDDGIIQITENGGESWRKIEVSSIPGIPVTAFVNDIKTDLFEEGTVYVALDNHKYGDFTPYLLKSTDKGLTWTSLVSNLPDRTLVWRIVQDHVQPNLMFIATEFGVYTTLDGGAYWMKLKGAPTIAFRDLVIQKRENDLVCASFGRSFYILDDYTPLRELSDEIVVDQEAHLFKPAKAYRYSPGYGNGPRSGSDLYSADNPPYGAVFTYHLKEGHQTMKAERKEKEKELARDSADIPFPGWEALEAENRETGELTWLTIKDKAGTVVDRVKVPGAKGMHRVSWNLRYQSNSPINPAVIGSDDSPLDGHGRGTIASPGEYSASLSRDVNGNVSQLAGPVSFEVVPLREGALEPRSVADMEAFRQSYEDLSAKVSAMRIILGLSKDRVAAMRKALLLTEREVPELSAELIQLREELLDLDIRISGSKVKGEIGELDEPNIQDWLRTARQGLGNEYGPTLMHEQNLEYAGQEYGELTSQLESIITTRIPDAERKLAQAGAPWIVGQVLPKS